MQSSNYVYLKSQGHKVSFMLSICGPAFSLSIVESTLVDKSCEEKYLKGYACPQC